MDRRDGSMALGGRRRVLVVAGSDSSGGAGIARDIETIASLNLRTCLAVTAVTVQTDAEARGIVLISPGLVADQMRAALAAGDVRSVKIGMLGSTAIVSAVAAVLAGHPGVPVVLDPVLAASSGTALLELGAIEVLKAKLMPLCDLVTPNWTELATLAHRKPADDETEAIRQGEMLLASGCGAVLVKGGHAPDAQATDILLDGDKPPVRFTATRVGEELRGTGCMLASAIAAHLAAGTRLEESVRRGKARVLAALTERPHWDDA